MPDFPPRMPDEIDAMKATAGRTSIQVQSPLTFSTTGVAAATAAALVGFTGEFVESLVGLLDEETGKVTIAGGGTGAGTAAGARVNLGVEIGVNVQAYHANLSAVAALTATTFGMEFLELADQSAALDKLGASALGRTLLQIVNEAAARAALELTSAATGDAGGLTHGTIDPARIPVLPGERTIVSSGGLTDLTGGQQALIGEGTKVAVVDGKRWVYKGTGSKTDSANYHELADITPDWSVISSKPAQVAALVALVTTAFGFNFLELADAAAGQTKLNLVPGTHVQAFHAALASLAGLTTAADRSVYTTGPNVYATYVLTAAGRAMSGAADVAAQRALLALGDAATLNLATRTQAEAGSSNGLLMTPQRVREAIGYFLRSNYRQVELSPAGWAFNTNSPAQSASRGTDRNVIDITTGGTTGTFAHVRNNPGGTNMELVFPGDQYNIVVWSRPVVFNFTFAVQSAAAATVVRIKFGDFYSSDTVADFTNRGVGVIIENTSVKMTVHDGTTLTTSPTALFTITSGGGPTVYACSIILDGAGNWTLIANGTSYTGTGAPTTNSAGNGCSISAGLTNGAGTAAVRLMIPEISVLWP